MKLTVEIDDESLEQLATAIAERLPTQAGVEEAADEPGDDLTGGEPPDELAATLTDVQDAIRKAAAADEAATVKALAKYKTAKGQPAKRGTELKEDDYTAFIADAAKIAATKKKK